MKKVIINRAWENQQATLGMLTVLGVDHPPIFTLENPLRETTVDSRIPYGEYYCEHFSGNKFPDAYKLKDVPGRTDILIHYGNTERDTLGCILVGLGASEMNWEPFISHSRDAFKVLKKILGVDPFHLQVNPVLAACWASKS